MEKSNKIEVSVRKSESAALEESEERCFSEACEHRPSMIESALAVLHVSLAANEQMKYENENDRGAV
jgi:hypothetical protein